MKKERLVVFLVVEQQVLAIYSHVQSVIDSYVKIAQRIENKAIHMAMYANVANKE